MDTGRGRRRRGRIRRASAPKRGSAIPQPGVSRPVPALHHNSYFDGTDQFLNLRYGRILSRRFTLDVKETAGITSLANGAFSYLPLTSSDLVGVPANELFDNTTYYAQTRASLTWQKTARLSFSGGGDDYLVRRRSKALAGLTGYGAHADVAYRVTRRQTLDLSYNYTHYEETHVFGYANIQTLAPGIVSGIGRRYDFGISAGASYLDYRGLETIQRRSGDYRDHRPGHGHGQFSPLYRYPLRAGPDRASASGLPPFQPRRAPESAPATAYS